MIDLALAFAFAGQTTPNPFDRFKSPEPKLERLGPGPHTLVISGRNTVTRIDYKTGPQCQRARDSARRQSLEPAANGLAPITSAITVICVPR